MTTPAIQRSPSLATQIANTPMPILRLLTAPLHALLSVCLGSFYWQWKRLVCLIFGAIFLVNIKSAPFAWHLRICRIVASHTTRKFLIQLYLLYRYPLSPEMRRDKFNNWFDSNISPVGLNPFKSVVTYSSRATPDDCDFNRHLSNSCYGKVFDYARTKAVMEISPNFFRMGGWLPLGATRYYFLREIPIFAKYEIRISVLTWDSKWVFIVGRFITKRKSRSDSEVKTRRYTEVPRWETSSITSKELSHEDKSSLAKWISAGYTNSIGALKILVASGRFESTDDDAIVHCVALSQVCFKIGRITIPPALVFASDGMTTVPPPLSSGNYVRPGSESVVNVPPHWSYVRKLRLDKKNFVKLLTGGWRDLPEGERWWEDAFSGEGEDIRLANLQVLK